MGVPYVDLILFFFFFLSLQIGNPNSKLIWVYILYDTRKFRCFNHREIIYIICTYEFVVHVQLYISQWCTYEFVVHVQFYISQWWCPIWTIGTGRITQARDFSVCYFNIVFFILTSKWLFSMLRSDPIRQRPHLVILQYISLFVFHRFWEFDLSTNQDIIFFLWNPLSVPSV